MDRAGARGGDGLVEEPLELGEVPVAADVAALRADDEHDEVLLADAGHASRCRRLDVDEPAGADLERLVGDFEPRAATVHEVELVLLLVVVRPPDDARRQHEHVGAEGGDAEVAAHLAEDAVPELVDRGERVAHGGDATSRALGYGYHRWAVTRATKSWAAACLVAVALAGCGGDGGSNDSDLTAPFAYDASKPLQVRTRSIDRGTGGIEVRDISFTGATGGRQDAYLVLPKQRTDRPAVIYAHGAGGDRYELLDEATKLAQRGAAAMTLDMSYSPRRARQLPTQGIPAVRARTQVEVDSVRDIRRGVDVLQSLPEVDDDRIGYVGWSAGARVGAVAAGVERRIKAFDLVAGGATPVSEYLDEAPQELRPQLEPILNRTDPLHYVGHASPSALFFQNGSQDEIVPIPALRALADEGSDPKEVRWYDSGHVPSTQAWADSRTWLADELDLS